MRLVPNHLRTLNDALTHQRNSAEIVFNVYGALFGSLSIPAGGGMT